MEEQKKNMLSLIQPTNTPHLGNYLGAMQNWVKLQNDYNCYFGIADLHSITVRQDPVKLRNQIKESYALLSLRVLIRRSPRCSCRVTTPTTPS